MTRTQHDLGVRDNDLRHILDRWAQQGLVTPAQVEQIMRAEQAGAAPTRGAGAGSPRSGNRLVVEALAYLGGVLALVAGLLLVQTWWPDLSTGFRLAVPLSAAVALLLAGQLVPGEAEERARLRSTLWLLGTGAWAAAAAVFGDQVLDAEPRDTVLLVGLAGLAVALPLYLRARTAAQQLGLFVMLALTAAAIGLRAGWDEPTLAGLGVWLVALTWFVLGERRVVHPGWATRYTAAIALVVGTLMMQGALGGQVLDAEPRDTVLLVGLAGLAVALPLYLRARTAAQQLGLFVMLALTAAAIGLRAGWDEPTLAGLGVWLVALSWLVLGERRVVHPGWAVRYTAAIALVAGALMMQGALGGQVLALVTIALLLAWGVRTDSLGLLAVACVGALQLIPSAVFYFFPDGGRTVVPLALLATGSLLVATAVTVTRRRARGAP
jgi:hypothetical protein